MNIKTQTDPQIILMLMYQSNLILNNFDSLLLYTQRLEKEIEQNREVETVNCLNGFDVFKLVRKSIVLKVDDDGSFKIKNIDDLMIFINNVEHYFIYKNGLTTSRLKTQPADAGKH